MGVKSTEAKILYEELKNIANKKEVITYGQVAVTLCLDLNDPKDHYQRLPEIIQEVNDETKENNLPMISCLIVHKKNVGDGMTPGDGFFKLMKEWGLMQPNQDRHAFWRDEVAKVHALQWR